MIVLILILVLVIIISIHMFFIYLNHLNLLVLPYFGIAVAHPFIIKYNIMRHGRIQN